MLLTTLITEINYHMCIYFYLSHCSYLLDYPSDFGIRELNSVSIFAHLCHSIDKDLQLLKAMSVSPHLVSKFGQNSVLRNIAESLQDSFKILAMPFWIHLGFPELHSTGVLSRFYHKMLMFCLPYLSSTNLYMYACLLPKAQKVLSTAYTPDISGAWLLSMFFLLQGCHSWW